MYFMTTLLSSSDAAKLLRYSTTTLRNSRYTGILAGVEAPAHLKLGKTVRYEKEVLQAWLSQFKPLSDIDKEVQ